MRQFPRVPDKYVTRVQKAINEGSYLELLTILGEAQMIETNFDNVPDLDDPANLLQFQEVTDILTIVPQIITIMAGTHCDKHRISLGFVQDYVRQQKAKPSTKVKTAKTLREWLIAMLAKDAQSLADIAVDAANNGEDKTTITNGCSMNNRMRLRFGVVCLQTTLFIMNTINEQTKSTMPRYPSSILDVWPDESLEFVRCLYNILTAKGGPVDKGEVAPTEQEMALFKELTKL